MELSGVLHVVQFSPCRLISLDRPALGLASILLGEPER
jgi:hypothetical protein